MRAALSPRRRESRDCEVDNKDKASAGPRAQLGTRSRALLSAPERGGACASHQAARPPGKRGEAGDGEQ